MHDDTLGPTTLVRTAGAHCTINLNVSYLALPGPGAFGGHGRVVELGKSVVYLEGEMFDPGGVCFAGATVSAWVVSTAALAKG